MTNQTLQYFRKIVTLIFVIGYSLPSFCQDSLLIETEISNECQGQHNLATIAKGGIGGVRQINNSNNILSDNPIFHFAIYNGIALKTTLNKKYSIETGLYMEERSFSHGNNTLSNLIIFPKIKLSAIDTFKIARHNINTLISAGDFWNEDFQDIIRFYNIDFQALEVNFGIKNWNFKTNVISDLSRNIGFNLHEMYKFQLQYKFKKVTSSIALSINELFSSPNGYHPQERDFNLTFYSKYHINFKSNFETQVDFRINKIDNASKAIGVNYSYHSNKRFNFHSSIRYIDFKFNKGYANFKTTYRNGSKFVGEQLYPLKNYYRPMKQWVFFISHKDRDIINFELNANVKYPICKKITFFADIDYNFIYATQLNKTYHYPLYNTGLTINFTKNFILTFSATNKQMNLDNFYQTFYISTVPLFSYNFKYYLENIKLRSKRIKI
ncbi:MAG: hypothetical protein HOP11_04785 [Saprospiraceae bacterium]|nr:hypothetical protein [Saprospiraceae bacterium]